MHFNSWALLIFVIESVFYVGCELRLKKQLSIEHDRLLSVEISAVPLPRSNIRELLLVGNSECTSYQLSVEWAPYPVIRI